MPISNFAFALELGRTFPYSAFWSVQLLPRSCAVRPGNSTSRVLGTPGFELSSMLALLTAYGVRPVVLAHRISTVKLSQHGNLGTAFFSSL